MSNRIEQSSKTIRESAVSRFAAITLLLCLAGSAACQSMAPLDDIVLPQGFSIEIFADDVPSARTMVLGDQGIIFVSSRREGAVYALLLREGARPEVITVISGLLLATLLTLVVVPVIYTLLSGRGPVLDQGDA